MTEAPLRTRQMLSVCNEPDNTDTSVSTNVCNDGSSKAMHRTTNLNLDTQCGNDAACDRQFARNSWYEMAFKKSKNQFVRFEQMAAQRYYRELEVFLREELPDECKNITSKEIFSFIEECERRCNTFEIFSEASVSQFAVLSIASGIYVDENVDIRAVLASQEIEPEKRLEVLIDNLDRLSD